MRGTPGRLRLASLVVLAALVVGVVVSWTALLDRSDGSSQAAGSAVDFLGSARRIDSALVDADAAATAAFLTTNDEDRAERRRYDDAMGRASAELVAAATLTDDRNTRLIAELNTNLTTYNAAVERARADRLDHGGPGTDALIVASAFRSETLAPRADELRRAAAAQLDRANHDARASWWRVVAGLGLSLVSVALFGAMLAMLSHRVLNLAVTGGIVILVASIVTVSAAGGHVGSLLDKDASAARATTDLIGTLRRTALELNTNRNASILGGLTPAFADDVAARVADAPLGDDMVAAARRGEAPFGGLLADVVEQAETTAERALAAEALIRWQRYVDAISPSVTGPVDEAARTAAFNANRAFTGFNVAVDSLLSSVESRHRAILDAASSTARRLPPLVLVAALTTAALVLAGAQQRIDDYR